MFFCAAASWRGVTCWQLAILTEAPDFKSIWTISKCPLHTAAYSAVVLWLWVQCRQLGICLGYNSIVWFTSIPPLNSVLINTVFPSKAAWMNRESMSEFSDSEGCCIVMGDSVLCLHTRLKRDKKSMMLSCALKSKQNAHRLYRFCKFINDSAS